MHLILIVIQERKHDHDPIRFTDLGSYRVVQKSWFQVARKVQPIHSQPQPSHARLVLSKTATFYTQFCISK